MPESPPPAAAVPARSLVPAPRLADAEPHRLRGWDGGEARLRTEVRLAREGRLLLAEFRCAYERLHVDPRLPRDRPAPRLWEHDVVELFVSDRPEGVPYRELEASPLGQWLQLAFAAPRRPATAPWTARPEVTARLGAREFEVTIALELDAEPGSDWRIGLYRIAGAPPAREHQALTPNGTPEPDFHRPSTWARLLLGG